MPADHPANVVDPDDVRLAAAVVREALAPALDFDWSVAAGDLAWDCRRTLDHVADSHLFYAAHLATRARGRLVPPRDGDPARSPAELLVVLEATAAVLAAVARATPSDARGFHGAGMADAEGFVAMGCAETLIHADDIARGLGVSFTPPADLAARVVRRLFPWAPTTGDPWQTLRWSCGRAALPGRDRLGPDWYWHCAPLAEWDGTVRKRTAPPMWR
jgi:uncharacterized protein (TIGR03083 family)